VALWSASSFLPCSEASIMNTKSANFWVRTDSVRTFLRAGNFAPGTGCRKWRLGPHGDRHLVCIYGYMIWPLSLSFTIFSYACRLTTLSALINHETPIQQWRWMVALTNRRCLRWDCSLLLFVPLAFTRPFSWIKKFAQKAHFRTFIFTYGDFLSFAQVPRGNGC